jgi:hypothetical protein
MKMTSPSRTRVARRGRFSLRVGDSEGTPFTPEWTRKSRGRCGNYKRTAKPQKEKRQSGTPSLNISAVDYGS